MVYVGKIVYYDANDTATEEQEIHYVMVANDIVEVAQRLKNEWLNDLISFTCEEIGLSEGAVYFLQEETLNDIRRENTF